MQTTLGQLLVNEALPEDLRDYSRVMDKKGLKAVLQQVAEQHPDQYKEIASRLMNVGQSAATTGNFSFSLKDFQPPPEKRRMAHDLKAKVARIVDDPLLDENKRHKKIVTLLGGELKHVVDRVLADSKRGGSRLAEVVSSGSKGSPTQFNSTVGMNLMYLDHKDNPVPVPIFNSIAEGLDPAEYWASTYGTRKSMMDTKMAVAEAGYFGKKLGLSSSRQVVTTDDCETGNGIIVDGGDQENVGTILQKDTAGISAGTVIMPGHLKKLRGNKVMVRSPLTCEASHGLCSKCAGIRERGTFPDIGDNIGVTSASALGELLSQKMLSSKHTAGTATAKKTYDYADIERLFEMPKASVDFAPVAEADGVVKGIREAPAGGVYVRIGTDEYWAPSEDALKVKEGQHIEAGEVLTSGIPNPSLLARHRGIGDARRMFVDQVREVTGGSVSRRNAEAIARSVVSHVRVNNIKGPQDSMIGDISRYEDMVRGYEPREGSRTVMPSEGYGNYLEKPSMHYTIGTKINNRVIKDLRTNGIKNIVTNREPPSFEPDVQRMFAHSQVDPDWMTRMSGYHLTTSIPEAVHKGMSSDENSTSFVPSLAKGISFGKSVKDTGTY